MRVALLVMLLIGPLGSWSPAFGAEVEIEHQAVACVVTERNPRLDARAVPADRVASVRAFFRSAPTSPWYFVEMSEQGGVFSGLLPRPRKTLKSFEYYIEATDKSYSVSRSAEFSPSVMPVTVGCKANVHVAASLLSAAVRVGLLGGAGGAPIVPAGFSLFGVTALSAPSVAGAAGAGIAQAAGVPSAQSAAAVTGQSAGKAATIVGGGADKAGAAASGTSQAAGGGVATGSAAAEAAAVTATTAAAASGIGATALVLGGLGAAGAAVVGVTALSGGDEDDTAPTIPVPPAAPVDRDGDGYTVENGDCNDNDAVVKPGGGFVFRGVWPLTGPGPCIYQRQMQFFVRNNSCAVLNVTALNYDSSRVLPYESFHSSGSLLVQPTTVAAGVEGQIYSGPGAAFAVHCCEGFDCSEEPWMQGHVGTDTSTVTVVTDAGTQTLTNSFSYAETDCPRCGTVPLTVSPPGTRTFDDGRGRRYCR